MLKLEDDNCLNFLDLGGAWIEIIQCRSCTIYKTKES